MSQDICMRSNVYEIDLTKQEVKIFDTPEEIVRRFLGGRGLNMYYLHKYLEPSVDPLSPENVLIIGTGLLTSTGVPNSGRFNVTAKSPESGILGDANCGGFFGAKLRFAGVDRLILKGRAPELSYLYIENGKVEFRSAEEFRGLNTFDLQVQLRNKLGKDIQVLCIGEAGENLVRFACVMNNIKNAAGRCGMGAVMGSKNLKAIVVRGNGGIPIKHPKAFLDKVAETNQYLQKSKIVKVLGRVGTPLLYEVSNYLGAIRTHNSQLNAFEDTLNAEVIHGFVEKMLSCYGCIVHCRHRNFGGEGPEYTTIGLLGANVGVSDTKEVIEINNLCNDLGLDVSSCGTIIAWGIELYEKGYITDDMVERPLKFGDAEMVKSLMIDISKRRGVGHLLAESTQAVKQLGEETKDFLIAIKGLPQSDPHDVRYLKSFSLGIATASRGADHLRSRPTLDVLNLPEALFERIYGRKINPNPTAYETKEAMVFFSENIYSLIDSLGICKFICHGFNSPQLLKHSHFIDFIRLTTGMEFTREDLENIALRIVDLERLINTKFGISRKDDTLPGRYFDDPMKRNLAKGHHIDREKFQEMLSAYYEMRNWSDDGQLKPERVKELEAIDA